MPMSMEATVTVVPHRLYIVSFLKEYVSLLTHGLLRIIFFANRDSYFMSYTETLDDISMVIDENLLHIFMSDFTVESNKKSIRISANVWTGIQFSIASPPTETKGFINTIAGPLSAKGISIFYLYTFNTDYILFEEQNLESAKTCLRENFNVVGFDDGQSIFLTIPIGVSPKPSVRESFSRLQSLTDLTLVPTSFSRETLSLLSIDLIELVFYPKSSNRRFFSFSQTEGELSLLIDTQTLDLFSGKIK